jgi:predicted unusual protein kinase regulating ubiquinone biosynthesis (AarF/ABC1/UbiB family)
MARAGHIARLGTRAGGGYAWHRARRVFASVERRDTLDAAHELRTADQVAAALGDMKGALMKLGQMASYLDAGLPEPFRLALAQLQQDAPPMSASLAAGVVEGELGAAPEQVFAEWDPVPIAAASIGQVHRAITRDDRAVAVKVQYPGVAEAITSDLDNAGVLLAILRGTFPGLEARPLVDELRVRLAEELDYVHEADNQRLFAAWYDGHPFIHVPAVVDELCTRRVLTTDLASGARFEELEQWPQEERDLAAETIFRFVFRSLYRIRAFNGDPHPGNYLFGPGGDVTFLDFGLVKRFTDDDIAHLLALIRWMVLEPDAHALRVAVEEAGFMQPGAAVSDDLVREYFVHFYEFVLEDRVGTIGDDFASETVRRYFDANGPYREVLRAANLPPSFVIIQRINLGLYAILARLHATANWRRLAEEMWPSVDAPPSTELGRREATWWERRRASPPRLVSSRAAARNDVLAPSRAAEAL